MEFVIGVACVIVILIVIGVPVQSIIGVILWLMVVMALLCAAFFLFMILLACFTKKKEATYLRLEAGEKMGAFALYEIEGKEYRNTFPTDSFLEKILYREGKCKVRFRETSHVTYVFDKVTIFIIATGFPAFLAIAVLAFIGLSM